MVAAAATRKRPRTPLRPRRALRRKQGQEDAGLRRRQVQASKPKRAIRPLRLLRKLLVAAAPHHPTHLYMRMLP